MRKDTENWVALADYDLETARHMLAISIPTRYPEDLQRTIQDYPRPVAENYLVQTETALKWLRDHLEAL